MEAFHINEPSPAQNPSPSWDQRTSGFARRALLPTLLVGILEIGTLFSLPDPEIAIGVADVMLFLYLSWVWEARQWGSRTAAIAHGIGTGLTLGLIIGLMKFLLWKKFYSLFFLVSDPILKAIIAAVVIGVATTLLRSPKLHLFFQRFKRKS